MRLKFPALLWLQLPRFNTRRAFSAKKYAGTQTRTCTHLVIAAWLCKMKMSANEGRNFNRLIRTCELVGYHSNAEQDLKVFCNTTPHRLVNSYWRFGVVCCFHPQSRRIQEAPQNLHQNQTEATWLLLAEGDRIHMFCNSSVKYVARTWLSLHNLYVQFFLSVMRFQIRWHYQYRCNTSRYRD